LETVKNPGDNYSDVRYTVVEQGVPVLDVGFQLTSVMDDWVYVTLRPMRGIRGQSKAFWRRVHDTFCDVTKPYKMYCYIDSQNRCAKRFAEFFGFEEIERTPTVVTMVKEK